MTFYIVIAVIGILLIVVSQQPAEFKIVRSTTMAVPVSAIFPHVNNLRKWEAWSPWAKLDPNAKNSFEGPEEGVGAVMCWEGNCKVGVGSMTITESRPNEAVNFKLDFLKPMKATSYSEFSFKPEGSNTLVIWSMSGTNNFMGKFMSLFMNCEKMVGGHFEKGLASIKAIVEK
ncbi:MAG: SRPBCC family protein [Rickettsiales bacterium]